MNAANQIRVSRHPPAHPLPPAFASFGHPRAVPSASLQGFRSRQPMPIATSREPSTCTATCHAHAVHSSTHEKSSASPGRRGAAHTLVESHPTSTDYCGLPFKRASIQQLLSVVCYSSMIRNGQEQEQHERRRVQSMSTRQAVVRRRRALDRFLSIPSVCLHAVDCDINLVIS